MNLSYFKHYDLEGRIGFTEDMVEKKDEILKILPSRQDKNRFNGFLKFINSKKEDLDDFSKVIYFLNGEKVIVNCKKHGSYKISPNSYMANHRCDICGHRIISKDEFKEKLYAKFNYIEILTDFIF